jgi:cyclase
LRQVTENVYIETELTGCNPSFVTTSEGVVMIDMPHRPSDAVRWRWEVGQRGELRYIIITEPHGDHCSTGYLFAGTLVSHEGAKKYMRGELLGSPMEEVFRQWAAEIDPAGAHLIDGFYLRLPAITFSERLTLSIGSHTFELIHMPGHTASQIAVHVPQEKVVFTGDNVVHKVQTWLHEACPVEWLDSLRRIEALDPEVIVPGHGDVCSKEYLKEQAACVREWIGAVREAIDQGLSKQEAQARVSLPQGYPMDIGYEALAATVRELNVARLYDLLTTARKLDLGTKRRSSETDMSWLPHPLSSLIHLSRKARPPAGAK